jgi:hypothetical protein
VSVGLQLNPTLRLSLFYNDIGDDGAAAIAEALKLDTGLHKLNLCDNDIGGAGAAAIADVLKVNSSLQELELRGNGFGEALAIPIQAVKSREMGITRKAGLVEEDGCYLCRLVIDRGCGGRRGNNLTGRKFDGTSSRRFTATLLDSSRSRGTSKPSTTLDSARAVVPLGEAHRSLPTTFEEVEPVAAKAGTTRRFFSSTRFVLGNAAISLATLDLRLRSYNKNCEQRKLGNEVHRFLKSSLNTRTL